MADQAYQVVIFRRDGNNIKVLEGIDFDKIKACWKTLSEKWESSSNENKPFMLEDPIVTSFHPGLISEIAVLPSVVVSKKEHNPYKKQMLEEGFGNRNSIGAPDYAVKDGGYI